MRPGVRGVAGIIERRWRGHPFQMRAVRDDRNPVRLPIVAYCDERFCVGAKFGMIVGNDIALAGERGQKGSNANDTTKEDAMTISRLIAGRSADVWKCHADDSVADAVAVLATKRIGALPVEDHGEPVAGIFSERDVLYCLQKHGAAALDMKVRDVMTAPAISIEPDMPVLHALSLMTRRRIRHLPVVADGKMLAFVSIGDLVKFRIDRIEAEAEAMREYIQSA
jgi:CBS domain-containing protein